jgi:hypothetical protein
MSGSLSRAARLVIATLVITLAWSGSVILSPPLRASAAPTCDAVRSGAAEAALMAARCRQRVEVLSGRSETAQVFANPDGTSTFTSSAVPVRVHRPDGSWVPVDSTLRARADGWLAPVAAVTDMAFSPGGDGPFATYRDAGVRLNVGLGRPLPKPRIVGSSAVYPDVLPDVDLQVTASATSFRHVLVLKTVAALANPELASIRLVVGGDAKVAPASDGRVRFTDKAGRTVAMTAAASMWDSTVNPGGTGEVTPAATRAALDAIRAKPPAELLSTVHGPGLTSRTAAVAVHAAPDGRSVVVTPDPSLLHNAAAALPVFIDPQIGPQESTWAYTRSTNGNYTMDGRAWVGRNPPDGGGDGSLFRAFFDFPTTSGGLTYKGKQILSASVSIMLSHSWSCGDTVTNMFRTDGIYVGNGARMDWNARPLGAGAIHIAEGWGHANKAGGCGVLQPDMLMTFGNQATIRNDVQAVANAYWDYYTVGLCACDANGSSESTTDRWKKFHVDGNTTMSVTYNTVPGTPANLSPHQGQATCGSVIGTTSPVLQAQYADEDGSDTLTSTFKWQQLPSGPVTTVVGPAKPANNNGSVTLNLGAGAEGRSYQFQVMTNDSHADSPWSPWCQFTVDTTAPPAPVIASASSGTAPIYPSCNPAAINSCVPVGGPGVAGAFTFSEPAGTAGQDVVKYVYGWDSPTDPPYTVAPGAPTPAILYTPPHYGLNKLTAYSIDGTGHTSPTTSYYILVGAPSAALAYWPLDSINGHGYVDQVSGAALATTNVSWTADARYIGASAATFNGGTGEATQSVPSFDTSGSFSISAWVRLAPTTCGGNQTAVAIDADPVAANNHASAFYLGYDCANQRWRMRVTDRNVASPSIAEAVSPNASAVPGRWTHLVGLFQEDPGRVQLWVDGTLVQATAPTAAFMNSRAGGTKATGPVTLGRDRWNDTNGGRFTGEIADVRLWNRVLVRDDITGTNANPATGVPAADGLTTPLMVGWWAFSDNECFCDQALDGSPFGRKATLVPDALLDPNWNNDPATAPAWLVDGGHDGNGGLRVDGLTGYASTSDNMGTFSTADDIARPVVRTDQSITFAAWANLTQISNVDQVVVNAGPLSLFFRGWEHKWGATMSIPNGSGGWINTEARSDVVAQVGTWTHLVGVYDASTGQVRLYVNGVQQSNIGTGATPLASTGSLRIGAKGSGFYFGGTIDDVRVWQGVLNAREIAYLYSHS